MLLQGDIVVFSVRVRPIGGAPPHDVVDTVSKAIIKKAPAVTGALMVVFNPRSSGPGCSAFPFS